MLLLSCTRSLFTYWSVWGPVPYFCANMLLFNYYSFIHYIYISMYIILYTYLNILYSYPTPHCFTLQNNLKYIYLFIFLYKFQKSSGCSNELLLIVAAVVVLLLLHYLFGSSSCVGKSLSFICSF